MSGETTLNDIVRVAVIEDDVNTRHGLCEKIESEPRFSVVAACGSLSEARAALQNEVADVLLVDLQLPDGSGLEIIREQTDARPDLPVLVISVFGDENSVVAAIEAGAQGYLLKSDTSLEIRQSITELLSGGAPISSAIARHLIKRMRSASQTAPDQGLLSERELEVLNLAAKGYSYQDIAELLDVKVSTISSYTRRLYQKLSVHSKSEAVFEGLRMGLVEGPDQDPR